MENAGRHSEGDAARSRRFTLKSTVLSQDWLLAYGLPSLFLAFGVAVRLVQYGSNRSLWSDEAKLALNLIERSFSELWQPLSYAQAAPIGFLMVEKALVQFFGSHEYVLRVIPLLGGFATLGLGYVLAKRFLSPLGAVVAIALIASSERLIYYSSELKQYSTDVTIALLITLVLTHLRKETLTRTQLLWGAGIGAIAVWFSYPAVFVLAGLEASYLLPQLTQRWQRREPLNLWQRLPMYGAWLLSFGLFYWVSVQRVSDSDTLEGSWEGRFPSALWDVDWLIGSLKSFFVNPLGFAGFGVVVAIACFLLGCGILIRQRRWLFWLLVAPVIVSIVGAYAHLYPFYQRLSLYLVPFFLLLMAAGSVVWEERGRIRFARIFGLILVTALLVQPLIHAVPLLVHADHREAMRPLMAYLQANCQAEDVIYVAEKSEYQFRYYAARYGFQPNDYRIGVNNLDAENWEEGVSNKERDRTIADLETLRGEPRVWVVLSDIELRDEMKVVRSHLNDTARKLDQFQNPYTTSFLYLYDLSQSGEEVKLEGGDEKK